MSSLPPNVAQFAKDFGKSFVAVLFVISRWYLRIFKTVTQLKQLVREGMHEEADRLNLEFSDTDEEVDWDSLMPPNLDDDAPDPPLL